MNPTDPEDVVEEVWPVDESREGDRLCPACRSKMRVERKGKVVVDLCPEHGVWLDAGELETICRTIRNIAAGSKYAALRQARRQETARMTRYHWWGLFAEDLPRSL